MAEWYAPLPDVLDNIIPDDSVHREQAACTITG